MAYASEEEENLARELDYEVYRTSRMGHSFMHGKRHVWSTRIGWQTANLIDGHYRNHEIFEDLKLALRRPL